MKLSKSKKHMAIERALYFSKIKNQRGITLVALVIIIIILLILAGTTILQLTESKLFENAKLAKEKSENSQALEETILSNYEEEVDKNIYSSQREGNGKKNKLWEVNPEATDANNGMTKGTVLLSDKIDNYNAVMVVGQMVDGVGEKYAAHTMLILKEDYYINTAAEENITFSMNWQENRSIYFTFVNNIELNKTEMNINYPNGGRIVKVYGINFL